MIILYTVLIVLVLLIVIHDGTSIYVCGKPVNHKKLKAYLDEYLVEGNYSLLCRSNDSMVASHKYFKEEILTKGKPDLLSFHLNISGVLIGGYCMDQGTIWRFSKSYRRIKKELKRLKKIQDSENIEFKVLI